MAGFIEEKLKKKFAQLKSLHDDGFLSDQAYEEETERLKEEFIHIAFSDNADNEEDEELDEAFGGPIW